MQRLFDHFGFAKIPDADPAWGAILSPEDDRHMAGPSEGAMRRYAFFWAHVFQTHVFFGRKFFGRL